MISFLNFVNQNFGSNENFIIDEETFNSFFEDTYLEEGVQSTYYLTLAEGLTNPYFINNPKFSDFSKEFRTNKDKLKKSELLKQFYDAIKPHLNKVQSKFVNLMKKNTSKFRGDIEFIYNMKPPTSLINKVIERNKPFEEINDLVRGMVITNDQKTLDNFVKDFIRKNRPYLGEIEFKERGQQGREYGYYGSWHFLIEIEGFYVELQAMTKQLAKAKDKAHKIYVDTRVKGPTNYDSQLSRKLFDQGNRS